MDKINEFHIFNVLKGVLLFLAPLISVYMDLIIIFSLFYHSSRLKGVWSSPELKGGIPSLSLLLQQSGPGQSSPL